MFTYHKWITLKLLLIPVVKVEVWNVLLSIDLWMMGVHHLQIDVDFFLGFAWDRGKFNQAVTGLLFSEGTKITTACSGWLLFCGLEPCYCMAPCKFAL
jgi:hypothetical protein